MSNNLKLHIITFDVPFPADYGGVIDVFYKIRALSEAGTDIILHCFQYGRLPAPELNQYCSEVYYYPRNTSRSLFFKTQPYIVLSRMNADLKKRLLRDELPILMEGMHSTGYLADHDLANRFKIVRTHNVEHEYYAGLAKSETNIFKRYYFYSEAEKLKKHESVFRHANAIAAISPSDTAHHLHKYPGVHYVPAFHPYEQVDVKPGKSDYALYHGNLSVSENNEAALYLVREIFNDLPYKLVIAGNRASAELKKAVKGNDRISIREEPTEHEMEKLIRHAQCNVLPAFQATGIKLKLLSALFLGRKCIVNSQMVINSGLESLCILADSPERMKEKVAEAMEVGFPMEEISRREEILLKDFSNKENVRKLIQLMT